MPELTTEENPSAIGLLFSERESDNLAALRTRDFIGIVAGAEGLYTCIADNGIEISQASVFVDVQG